MQDMALLPQPGDTPPRAPGPLQCSGNTRGGGHGDRVTRDLGWDTQPLGKAPAVSQEVKRVPSVLWSGSGTLGRLSPRSEKPRCHKTCQEGPRRLHMREPKLGQCPSEGERLKEPGLPPGSTAQPRERAAQLTTLSRGCVARALRGAGKSHPPRAFSEDDRVESESGPAVAAGRSVEEVGRGWKGSRGSARAPLQSLLVLVVTLRWWRSDTEHTQDESGEA